jgi:hypothetical protein
MAGEFISSGRAGAFTVAGPSKRPDVHTPTRLYTGIRAGGAKSVSPALQRGDVVHKLWSGVP